MTMIKKLLIHDFFPLADHVKTILSHTQNMFRNKNPLQNQGMTDKSMQIDGIAITFLTEVNGVSL